MSISAFLTPQLHGFFESSKVMRHKAAITVFGKKVPVLPGAFLACLPNVSPYNFSISVNKDMFHHFFLFSQRLALMNSQCTEYRRRGGVYGVLFNHAVVIVSDLLLLAWAFVKDQQDKNRKERLKMEKKRKKKKHDSSPHSNK